MGWIKTEWDFGYPYCVFTLGVREARSVVIRDGIKVSGDDPVAIEKLVLDIIKFYRPNLEGCTVVCISMQGGLFWKIGVTHPSLPRMKIGEVEACEPLIPQEQARDRVFIYDEPITRTE